MAATKEKKGKSARSIEAVVSHPLRARIWIVLVERVASPTQLADLLGAELSDVAYHVKALRKAAVIEEVDSRPVRGAVEHFYKAVERLMVDDEEYAAMSAEERADFDGRICQLAFADAVAALDQGTFCERVNHAAIRIPGQVDAVGFDELRQAMEGTMNQVFEILAASAARRVEDPESESIPITAVLMSFEKPREGHTPHQ